GRSTSIRPRTAPRRGAGGGGGGGGRRAGGQGGGQAAASASPAASPEASPQDQQAALAAFAAQQGFGGGFGGAALASHVVPAPAATDAYRFYCNTSLIMSSHNPSILYVRGDCLFRSLNRPDSCTASSCISKNNQC